LKHFDKKRVLLSKALSLILLLIYLPILFVEKLWKYFSSNNSSSSIKKILLVDLHLIGDIVMLTPLLVEIKKLYPNSLVTLMAGSWADQILLNNPNLVDSYCFYEAPWVLKGKHGHVDLIKKIIFLRKEKFDLAIDARGDFRNIFIMKLSSISKRVGFTFSGGGWLLTNKISDSGELDHVLAHHHRIAHFLGSNIELSEFKPVLWLSNIEKDYIKDSSIFIAMHLGASSPLRLLSIEKSSELIKSLLSQNKNDIVLFYSSEIKNLIDKILLIPEVVSSQRVKIFKGSLREFIVKVASSKFYVGMDSSGAHMAAALKVPSIVIFGPALPKTCQPIGENVHVVSSNENLECRPCNQKNCTNKVFQKCYKTLDFDKHLHEKINF
jgi:ADP-heptose:LPS heptosyltransferase